MEIIAKAKSIRISPRKVRLVTDALAKKPLGQILVDLKFIRKRATKPLLKVINSAIANAKHNFGIEKENLILKKIEVGVGSTMKRYHAASRGRAHQILKRTTNIKVILEGEPKKEKPEIAQVQTKITEKEKPKLLEKIIKRKKVKNGTKG